MKSNIITIQDLLRNRGVDFDLKGQVTKLVRHMDNRPIKIINGVSYKCSLYQLYKTDKDIFLAYQREQLTDNFKNVDYIVSFIADKDGDRFIGVFKNNGIISSNNNTSIFDFVEQNNFDVLRDKVVIDWGSGYRQWLQNWSTSKEVKLIDKGFNNNNIPYFTTYTDIKLDYTQLKSIFDSEDKEWKSKLEAINCIYLILDKNNGKLYVGSTYNSEGIWGRWSDYASSGHGGDVDLTELCKTDPDYAKKHFQWSILETLSLNITQPEAIDRESLYKEKLGSRQFGYNNN